MMIDIVTHCYAAQLKQYATFLDYHLWEFVLSNSRRAEAGIKVRVVVCYNSDDLHTKAILRRHCVTQDNGGTTQIVPLALPVDQLGRRSIGRNLAALHAVGDLVWFCDVDHVITFDCLKALADLKWPEGASMIYPDHLKIHANHALGDELVHETSTRVLNPADFVVKKYNRAIGGVQIVQGEFATRYGYLAHIKKWQKPVEEPFQDFRDDLAYRRFCKIHGRIVPVELPGLYRIRHTRTTYQ